MRILLKSILNIIFLFGLITSVSASVIDGVNDTIKPNITIINPVNGSTITTTSTWLNVTTNELASCTYGQHKCPTNEPMLSCEIYPVTNISTNNGTFHFKEIGLQSSYTYTIDVNCIDNFSNVNTKSVIFYVAFPQSGGGGGGGGGPANASNITKKSSGFDINIISPLNNSIISDDSAQLSIFTNKYATCKYSLDSSPFTGLQEAEETTVTLPPGIEVEGDAWQVQTSNHLELSGDGSSFDTIETLRNITTYVDKNNLKALASGSISNNKVTSPFNQYFYLLGPGTGASLDTGYVIYTENDEDITADFLYFKSGKEIGRYLIEFTTALESDVDDSAGSASSTGLFLTDFQGVDVTLFGKKYTIVTAKRTTTVGNNVVLTLMGGVARDTLLEKQTKTYTIRGIDYEVTLNFVDADEAQFVINGQTSRKMKDGDTDKLADGTTIGVTDVLYQDYAGGIHSATFFIGANKLELKDTAITDVASSNNLKVDDNTIDDAQVIIEGSDTNSTFKITRIHINMSADDNFFVAAGKKLTDAIKEAGGSSAEPQVLFTENWDIEYKGLKKVNTEKIKLKTSGSSQYNLEFVDGDGNKVDVPIAKAPAASKLLFGDSGKDFINIENSSITKDDYFVVTDGSRKRGERKTYVLQYKGADKVTADNPVLKFKDLGSGKTIEQTFSAPTSATGELATLKVGGADFRIFNATDLAPSNDMNINDFAVRVDMDASGTISGVENATVNITTRYGAEIGLTNKTTLDPDVPHVMLTIKTPDSLYDGNAKDSEENMRSLDYVVNITGDSNTKVAHAEVTGATGGQLGQKVATRTPDGQTNIAYGFTSYGTFITRETPSSEPATLDIEYPESQRYPLVYITTKGASFSETGASTTDAVMVQRIEVGAAKLASEVSDPRGQNAIFVGGPCANAGAAAIMGNPTDCTAGFEPGVGLIQVWEHTNGNVAMLVAGYSAVDTRNAAAVVANYRDYKAQLKGTKVEVRKVNNQLTVAAPATV